MFEALGRLERRLRALPLERRVRRDGRPGREAVDVVSTDGAHRRQHGLLLPLGRRHLCRPRSAVLDQDGMVKRPADVDAEDPHRASLGHVAATVEIPLRGPAGEPVDLWRTIVSHGVASLPPADIDEDARVMTVTLPVAGAKARTVRIRQGSKRRAAVDVLGPPLGARSRSGVEASVRRVLNLDENLSPLYEVAAADPDLRWIVTGAGRMARGATV